MLVASFRQFVWNSRAEFAVRRWTELGGCYRQAYSCTSKHEEMRSFLERGKSKLYYELTGQKVTALPNYRKTSCYT